MYYATHCFTGSGPRMLEWPDAGSLMEQPVLTVVMFNMIHGQMMEQLARDRESQRTSNG